MNTANAPLDETPPCDCGARLEEGRKLCRKCAAALRWERRQAHRRRNARRRGESRRPAGRPRTASALGVRRA